MVKNKHNRRMPPAAAAMMMYISSGIDEDIASVGLAAAAVGRGVSIAEDAITARECDVESAWTLVLEVTLEYGARTRLLMTYGSLQFPVTRSLLARTYSHQRLIVKCVSLYNT